MDVRKSVRGMRVAAVVLTLAMVSACGEKDFNELIAAAKLNLASGKHAAAAIELRLALEQSPNSAEARYLWGQLLLEQGRYGHALVELTKARDANFDEAKLAPAIAKAMLFANRFHDVLEQFVGMQVVDPKARAELLTAVAIAHLELGQTGKGEVALAEALEADPNNGWALVTKARIVGSKGDLAGALSLVDRAIATGTSKGESWQLKGALLQSGGKDLAQAEAAYKEAAKYRRYTQAARTALVGLYLGQRRLDDLRALYEVMQKADPKGHATLIAAAQLAYVDGDFKKSREVLDSLLRLAPNDARLLAFAGSVDLARGALLSAETQLGKAVNQAGDFPAARRLLAQTYLRLGDPDKALAALRTQLEGASADADTLAIAGEAQLQRGDFQAADRLLSAAVQLRPDDAKLRTASALTDLVRGHITEGFAALNQIAAADPGGVADKALISAHLRRGDYDAALAAVDRLAGKSSAKAGAEFLRAQVLMAKGDAPGAKTAFEAVLRKEPAHHLASASLANLELQGGDAEGARRRLEAAAAANPNSAEPRLAMVRLLGRTGAPPAAITTALESTIAAVPGEAAPRVMLVTHLLTQGDPRAALVVAQQAQSAFPDRADVLDALGRAQADAGNEQQAISTFGKLATTTPRSPMAQLRLADLHAKRKDFAAAAVALKKAHEIAPELEDVHTRMVHLGRLTKNPGLALDAAKGLQRRRPESPIGFVLEGDAYAAQKNWAAAVAAYKRGLGKPDPASRSAIRTYQVYLASGQTVAADRFADEWLRGNGRDAAFALHLAERAMSAKDNERAERLFAQVVAINPKSAIAYNNLAWLQAMRRHKDAVMNAERAVALTPGSSVVLDTLATALVSQRDFPRAIEVQRRAMALAPQDASLRLNLAQIYVASGDKAKAQAELETLEALGDKFPGHGAVAALKRSLAAR